MAKHKHSKSAAGKGPKVGASNVKSTHGKNRSKPLPKVQTPAPATLFERTRRRIKAIGKRALAKLRGKGTAQ